MLAGGVTGGMIGEKPGRLGTRRSTRHTDGERDGRGAPLHGHWQLPRARDRLHHDIGLLDTAFFQLGLCAGEQRFDDGVVPARVDDANAQGAAVVGLGDWAFGVHVLLICKTTMVYVWEASSFEARRDSCK